MTQLPTASEEQINGLVEQLHRVLSSRLRFHDNFAAMRGVPQVNTNIGTFLHYGLNEPAPIGRIGEITIREARPHSKTLMVCSTVPTSNQKILLIEAVTMRLARRLGAPVDANVDRKDPTRGESVLSGAEQGQIGTRLDYSAVRNRVEGELQGEGARHVDPYKTIAEPYLLTVSWSFTGK